ncbi:TIGR03943 family putative permease subunit [Streptomyces sp. NPDC007264]|uniref:TIGR03943 family putative permease subunit n=1 Tax=Streptomyces sp. NPDC007264 TaxID=3364777 RepID=UPI0036DE76B7
MKRSAQVALVVLSGLGLLHAALFTDLYLRYVKEGLRPLLIASGVLLLVLGVAGAVPAREGNGSEDGDGGGTDGHAHDHDHDHSAVPRIAWLLLLPVLSLLFYAPPALGAYTAAREAPRAVRVQERFDPLPATSPLPMTLTDFTTRVQQDHTRAVQGRTIRMTGFVTPGKEGGWDLTRLILSCCAADAQSVKVRMYGGPELPADTWVSVTGRWHPGGTLGTASAPVALDVRTVERVPRPVNGYTDALPLAPR